VAKTSTFYFNGNANNGREFIREMPIFAITTGNFASGWMSENADSMAHFKQMADTVNVQVPVHIALPRTFANKLLTVGKQYSSLSVTAFKPQINLTADPVGGFMSGPTFSVVLEGVEVKKVTPIAQWKGLPIPPQIQKNALERKIGRETYIPVAVSLFVYEARVV